MRLLERTLAHNAGAAGEISCGNDAFVCWSVCWVWSLVSVVDWSYSSQCHTEKASNTRPTRPNPSFVVIVEVLETMRAPKNIAPKMHCCRRCLCRQFNMR